MLRRNKRLVLQISLGMLFLGMAFCAFYEINYPKYLCKGELHQQKEWTDDQTGKKINLLDRKTNIAISVIFKRGAIFLNDEKYPLYRELNYEDSYAEFTDTGFKGYKKQFGFLEQKIETEFKFNKYSNSLYTSSIAGGMMAYENNMGHDRVSMEFVGACERMFP